MVRFININKSGFTVIELMISISVFSVAMMSVMSAVMIMGRQYQKASYTTSLNSASRTFHQALSADINYGGYSPEVKKTLDTSKSYVCLDKNIAYSWEITKNSDIKYGLYRGSYSGVCDDGVATDVINTGTNVLPKNGFVAELKIEPSSAGTFLATTDFRTGDNDMFTDSTVPAGSSTKCLPLLRGGDFCSIVQYNSYVKKRI